MAPSPTSLQKLLERLCLDKKYMRFLFESHSRTLLICIFLNLVNVTSCHFVITTDVSAGFGLGGVCKWSCKKKLLSSHIALNWGTVATKTR